jgi:cytoskeletal protein RodZ
MSTRVSLAELAASGFVLHSAEAAAIVVDLCVQLERGAIRGIPSTHVIRLTHEGAVVAEGPITTDQPPIEKAAQLLNDLLPPFDAPPAYRVPGGLRLVVARALGTLDLPPFATLDDFCAAVSRFAAADLASTARNLYRGWEIVKTPRSLTISDLRRARRATGLSLEDISSACGVSAALLRELEWGYLQNWRNDAIGRTWLSGYAKASGLDEQLVTSIVVPMFDETGSRGTTDEDGDSKEVALVASGPQAIVPASPPAAPPRRHWSMLWAVASAASIVLVAIVAMMAWPRPSVQASMEPTAPTFVPEPVTAPAVVEAQTQKPDDVRVIPAVQTHTAEKPRVAQARTTGKRAASTPARRPPSKPNFFNRQLLRIVIK